MLSIIGIAVLVIATIQAYKAARDSGRSPVKWALITFGIGFGIQIILPFLIGIVIGIVWLATGSSPEQLQEAIDVPAIIIGIVCLILSVIAVFLILRYLSKIPEEKLFTPPPQPPENFV